MATSNSFKGGEPYARKQLSEEFYIMGMNYTDQPLREGFSRLLVNFDFKANQGPLIPRPGIVTSSFALQPGDGVATDLEYNDKQAIAASRACIEGSTSLGQIILSDVTGATLDAASGLYIGTGYVITTQEQTTPPIFGDVPPKNMSVGLLSGGGPSLCYFRKPTTAGIHGMPIEDQELSANLVGTFAYGNSFFWFDATSNKLKRTVYETATNTYISEDIAPRLLTPKEAVLWGYNMLSSTPYHFVNTNYAGDLQLLGALPYDEAEELVMNPITNQNLFFECFYTAPAGITHKIKWEWREPGASSWTVLQDTEIDTKILAQAKCRASLPVSEAMIRITATKLGDIDPIAVMIVGFNFNKDAYGSTSNASATEYTLSKCKGMSFWKQRLVLFAPPEGKNLVFVSEVNDPGYFAYPNGAEIFAEDVISVQPFMDDLLVFTTSALYMMTPTPDGLGWITKKVQSDLNIAEQDVHLIKTVKNMLYFKSGNYYFMVVPSTKTKIGLALAPISDNIKSLLDNFEATIKEIFMAVYNYAGSFVLVDYNNYLDFDEIHNSYIVRTEDDKLVNFDLIYSTLSKSWRIYMYEVPGVPKLYNKDAANRGELVALTPIEQNVVVIEEVPAQ